MTVRICVSVLPQSISEALQLIKRANQCDVDFIEVRLDNIEAGNRLTDLTANQETPLIAADRSNRNKIKRQKILFAAAKSGFQYVDVDLSSPKLQAFINQVKAVGAKCIVSFHDYNKTIGALELNRILEREVSSGADVCKIVTTATKIEDNLTLLQFIQAASVRKKPVCFAMGELGKTSRLLSPFFGSFFTFAALEQGEETAPGQMTVQEMRAVYKLLGIE